MARINRKAIMAQYDTDYQTAIAAINAALPGISEADRTTSSAFGSLTLMSIRWQPASIGGTWGQYRNTNGHVSGYVVSPGEESRMALLANVTLPKYPRF